MDPSIDTKPPDETLEQGRNCIHSHVHKCFFYIVDITMAAKGDSVHVSVLSQIVSQLSMKESIVTSTMMNDLRKQINQIPFYLTKKNESFKEFLHEVLSAMKIATTNRHADQLRKIVLLTYKMMFIEEHQRLWTTYLKSGQGQLLNSSEQQESKYPVHFNIWSNELKATVRKSMRMNTNNEDEICTKFVQNYLNELKEQLQQYENGLIKSKKDFAEYTVAVNSMIKRYIEIPLLCIHREIDYQIELIYYDYHIQALKRVFEQQNPTKYQVDFDH